MKIPTAVYFIAPRPVIRLEQNRGNRDIRAWNFIAAKARFESSLHIFCARALQHERLDFPKMHFRQMLKKYITAARILPAYFLGQCA